MVILVQPLGARLAWTYRVEHGGEIDEARFAVTGRDADEAAGVAVIPHARRIGHEHRLSPERARRVGDGTQILDQPLIVVGLAWCLRKTHRELDITVACGA